MRTINNSKNLPICNNELYPTAQELLTISDYIKTFVYDYDLHPHFKIECALPIDVVLKPWYEAKQRFLFSLFKNKLIYKKSIKFQEPEKEINRKIEDLFKTDPFIDKLRSAYRDYLNIEYQNIDAYSEEYRTINEINYILTRGKKSSFRPVGSLTFKGSTIKNVRNMKITKIIRWISKKLNCEDGFEDFCTRYSRIFNTRTLYGNLCVSIHPLDYMTMSDNNCGWTSCMRWHQNEDECLSYGEYRKGTLSMMNCPTCIVAYLESEDQYKWGEEEYQKWNSKKWRKLFYVDESFILGNKAYPYENESLEDEVFSMLREMAKENLNLFFGEVDSFHLGNPIGDSYICIDEIDMDMMYNDFSANSYDTDWKISIESKVEDDNYSLHMYGEVFCLYCGCPIDEYMGNELLCDDCLNTVKCTCCGDRILNSEEVYFINDDSPLCEYCYHSYLEEEEEEEEEES